MTHILYDYQTFHIQRFGGISRYFYELARCMHDMKAEIAIGFSMNQYIRDKRLTNHKYIPKRMYKFMEKPFRKLNQHQSLKVIRKGDFDIFHPTYYNPYFLKALGNKPFVLTIHDMTHERYPQYFSPKDQTSRYKRMLAGKAARIIAISEYTKKDIIEFLGIPEEKIDVIHHGLNPQPLAEGKAVGAPENYILYVGERRGYKNFGIVTEAFANIARNYPDLHLVLTGRSLSKKEKEAFHDKGIEDKVTVMSDVSDRTLAQLYHNARLFVYPSLYEGFGIPVLEAFAQECPVVLSRASCFPEVAGEAAEYFNPESADDLATAMAKVLDDEELRKRMTARGTERLKLFTWENTARQTEETYRKVLGEG